MKAAVVTSFESPLTIEERPIPDPGQVIAESRALEQVDESVGDVLHARAGARLVVEF